MKKKWMLWLFVLLPFITEYIEDGAFAKTLRNWTTEITMTILISSLILWILHQFKLLEQFSFTDSLTNIPNRRKYELDILNFINIAKRLNDQIYLIFIDVNHFKSINDTYGHTVGDEVLKKIAEILQSVSRRDTDFCYRWGGDEFLILIIDQDKKNSKEQIKNHILKKIDNEISKITTPCRVTLSYGVTQLQTGESHKQLIERADKLMYVKKAANERHTRFPKIRHKIQRMI